VALTIEGGGRATLVGNIPFDSIGGQNQSGAIVVSSGGTLGLETNNSGDSIAFDDIGARWDIENAGLVEVVLEKNTSLRLSKGLGGSGGELEIKGPGTVLLGGEIDQRTIRFINNPLLSFRIDTLDSASALGTGTHINVQEGGSLVGSFRVTATLADSLNHFVRGEYTYIRNVANVAALSPQLSSDMIKLKEVYYNLWIKSGASNVLGLLGDIRDYELSEKVIVVNGQTKTVENSTFAVEDGTTALEVKSGGMVILDGTLTLRTTGYSVDSRVLTGNHIVLESGATIRTGDNGLVLKLVLSETLENFAGGSYNYLQLTPGAVVGQYEASMGRNYDTFFGKEYDIAHSMDSTYGTITVSDTDITGEVTEKRTIETGRTRSIHNATFSVSSGEALEIETGGRANFSEGLVLKPKTYSAGTGGVAGQLSVNHILVHSGSTIGGSPKISLNLTGITDDFTSAQFQYIVGDGVLRDNYSPTLATDSVEYNDNIYGLRVSPEDFRTLVLRKSLTGNINGGGGKHTVEAGSEESVVDAILSAGEEDALEIEAGAEVILGGTLTLNPTAQANGLVTGNSIYVRSGGKISARVSLVLADPSAIQEDFTRGEYNYIHGEGDWTELIPTLASSVTTINGVVHDVSFRPGNLGTLIFWGNIKNYELTEKYTIPASREKIIQNVIFNVSAEEALEILGKAVASGTLTFRPRSYSALSSDGFSGSLRGNHILVEANGILTMDNSVVVRINPIDISRHFTRGEYNYIRGTGTWTGFAPSTASSTVNLRGLTYDLLQRGSDDTMILWGSLEGDIPEKFTVSNGRTKLIANAKFSGLGNAGALDISGGGIARIEKSTIFENNIGEAGGGAIGIAANGSLVIALTGARDSVIFRNNRIGNADCALGDIVNLGSIAMGDLGILEFSGGGISGSGALTLDGLRGTLILDGALLEQGALNLGDENVLLTLNITAFDSSDEGSDRTTRGGQGGMISLVGSGTLVGSPGLNFSISGSDTLDALAALDSGESGVYRYVYGDSATTNGFSPSLSSRSKLLGVISGEQLWGKFNFPEGVPDHRTVQLTRTELKDILEDIVETNASPEVSPEEREALKDFLASKVENNSELLGALEYGDWATVDRIWADSNPDSNIVGQSKAMAIPVQLVAIRVDDRIFSQSLEEESFGASSALLVAAASRGAYGSLKSKMNDSLLPNRLWSQFLLSFGSQDTMDTSGIGFILGFDHRPRKDTIIGTTLSFSSDDAKRGSREISNGITAISLYGDYDFRVRNLRDLHLSALMIFGFASTKDNSLEGKGNVLYLAPRLGYRFSMKNLDGKVKDLRNITLTSEISLRYLRFHRDEQSGDIGKVSPISRNTISLVPLVRAAVLFRDNLRLTAKLGFSFDIYDGGDKQYSIVSPNGHSYQLLDRGKEISMFSTELGLDLGYRLSHNIVASVGYSGRYSSGLMNSSVSLGFDWRF
jgi:hypothetical protein